MTRWAIRFAGCAVALAAFALSAAASYPPLSLEISPVHPLFVFEAPPDDGGDAEAYASAIVSAWAALPQDIKPLSVLIIDMAGTSPTIRHARFSTVLARLEAANVPVLLRVGDSQPARLYPLEPMRELLSGYGVVRGVHVTGLAFNEYYEFGGGTDLGLTSTVRWLREVLTATAEHGRLAVVSLDGLNWPRVMSNTWCRPLYDTIRACRGYVAPMNLCRDSHNIARHSALMGLWLEDSAAFWGVDSTSEWYADAHFVRPGRFGVPASPSDMPPALYRAMILNGAMTGAAVYAFTRPEDLWHGTSPQHWNEAILPTLRELLARGAIARREWVAGKVRVAYQMTPARTSPEFHLNLRDMDGVFNRGLLVHGAYGMERPGQVSELVLNTGRHYWVPVLSPYASAETRQGFRQIVGPGVMTSAEDWRDLLARHYEEDGAGTAFISRVGRTCYVMHTRENVEEVQPFLLPDAPAPVTGFTVSRRADGVRVSWPFREEDIAYTVHKRVLPDTEFQVVADNLSAFSYTDPEVDEGVSVAYSVTALTNATAPYQGTVRYGEYRLLSSVESPIAEEALVTPLLGVGHSRPIERPRNPDTDPEARAWWPNYTGLNPEQMPAARAIVARIEDWERAFTARDVDGLMDLYSADYEDPQGWGIQYVRRAYMWFFQRYQFPRMARQIRRWDFSAYDSGGRVNVLLHCRFRGVALTDARGRHADLEASFPRTRDCETWVTFTESEGPWRIMRTNPAVPNFNDILSYAAGPYDDIRGGPDM